MRVLYGRRSGLAGIDSRGGRDANSMLGGQEGVRVGYGVSGCLCVIIGAAASRDAGRAHGRCCSFPVALAHIGHSVTELLLQQQKA